MPDPTKATVVREGDPLTSRELELLALVASGVSTADIAKQFGITPGTIKTHLTRIFRKTGTRNRVQASRYYLDNLRHKGAVASKKRPGSALDRDQEDATGRATRRRARLTRRELQVLELVSAGETTDAIARDLGLSEATIKTYLTSVYKKTGSQNRVQAARSYLRHYADADAALLADLEDDIADIKARLHELEPALQEAERLQAALDALQAKRRVFKR